LVALHSFRHEFQGSFVKAVWYERIGPAGEVLQYGDLPDPAPQPGEVRVRVAASGVNPSDAKTRTGVSKRPTMFPRIVPHSGGAGVVGHYAIQLAKWSGATVITTVSSARKAEHARSAGADFVIDYKQQPVAERILELTANRGVDRIVEVELGGNLPVTVHVLK